MHRARVKLLKFIRMIKRQLHLSHCHESKPRFSSINIQMLSESLHQQMFGKTVDEFDPKVVKKVSDHLKKHNLWEKNVPVLPDISFELPKFKGNSISEHFWNIAEDQSHNYCHSLKILATHQLPPTPSKWVLIPGWTKYNKDGTSCLIPYPPDDALIFDVEVCMSQGSFPTLATAASSEHWYSWCSSKLAENQFTSWDQDISISDLIPLETLAGQVRPEKGDHWKERVLVGHNVSFDRSFIKEQYFTQGTKLRFIDTMSLHIAVSGQTSYQRIISMSLKKPSSELEKDDQDKRNTNYSMNEAWLEVTSLNSLYNVHRLYCEDSDIKLNKEIRDVFVKGSIDDVRNDFQNLMDYCANDVKATHRVLNKVLPLFFDRFPHPVTFAGMLEMSTAYLPVNQNWLRYIRDCEATYDDLEQELKQSLIHLANDACDLLHDQRYLQDIWLWDLDWSTRKLQTKKAKPLKKSKIKKSLPEEPQTIIESDPDQHEGPVFVNQYSEEDQDDQFKIVKGKVSPILDTVSNLYKVRPLLPGYPKWYVDLCSKPSNGEDYSPGPSLISTQMRIVPKLLRLTWDEYPLHYSDAHGWGYLVPGRSIDEDESQHCSNECFPIEKLYEMYLKTAIDSNHEQMIDNFDAEKLALLQQIVMSAGDSSDYEEMQKMLFKKCGKIENKKQNKRILSEDAPSFHSGYGPHNDVKIPGCWFFLLPHKDGPKNRVGNPLSKDFLSKLADGTLETQSGLNADQALKLNIMLSYWKNNQKRIQTQMIAWLSKNELPRHVIRNDNYDEEGLCGAIIPRIIFAGTVTRRAVERTWMTASNAYSNRLGSELKSMIQAPPGYHFVGADVDSQELWIAALLGDIRFAGMHGCTALGWMTLQGNKSEGTDMHSKTANSIGITRNEAKIINYARIYGAKLPFAKRLLMKFNHRLSSLEAEEKAKKMFNETKGTQTFSRTYPEKTVWKDGSESEMFNKLEEIASDRTPCTPVLGCQISRALQPDVVGNKFIMSRVNWVVQSSAVDYLHLMLVNMKWLFNEFNIDGRFCISIHDEVRYLVRSDDRYRAALALQITNLFTRAMFSYRLGLNDLPQAIAFFSSIDVDSVLRKEVTMDCQTPSNPHGLHRGYGIPPGEALDIFEVLSRTNGGRLKQKKQTSKPSCKVDKQTLSSAPAIDLQHDSLI